MDTAAAIRLAAEALSAGDSESAKTALAAGFSPLNAHGQRRPWSKRRLVRLFLRDGFTDQYSGTPLVYPGALRALSALSPGLFPYHRNWKQSVTHPAYWLMYPTLDHIQPIAKNGKDDDSNIVATSMLRNAAKSNWSLDELGWPYPDRKSIPDWDGLLNWFCREYEANAQLRTLPVLRNWYSVAKSAA